MASLKSQRNGFLKSKYPQIGSQTDIIIEIFVNLRDFT